jgi:Uma2 family endonuclease
MATVETLLTAEEFSQLADNGRPCELVRGRIVEMNMPYPRHGEICSNVVFLLGTFARQRKSGRVVSNDSGVVTQRGPDSVRGADVAYYSYDRIPPGPLPRKYLAVMPEVIFEVRSPGDSWAEVLTKVAEYLTAGATAVCVLDEMSQTARVYRGNDPEQVFTAEQELILPEPLADFRVVVSRFFE